MLKFKIKKNERVYLLLIHKNTCLQSQMLIIIITVSLSMNAKYLTCFKLIEHFSFKPIQDWTYMCVITVHTILHFKSQMTHVFFLVIVPLFLWKYFFLSINNIFLSTIEKLKTFFSTILMYISFWEMCSRSILPFFRKYWLNMKLFF